MKTVSVTDTSSVQDLLGQVANEEVLVLQNGHAVAMVVPFNDDDMEWYVREREPTFLESIARARQQVADGKTISHEDLKRKYGIE